MKSVSMVVPHWGRCLLLLVPALWFGGCASVDWASGDWTPEAVHFDHTPLHYVWQGPDQSVYAGGGRNEDQLLRWDGTGWETLAPIPGRIHFGFTSSDGTAWFLTREVRYRRRGRILTGNIQGLWRWEPGTDSPEPVEGFDPESFRIAVSSVHFHAAEDKQGRIFLTTASPVIYLIEEGRFREWYTVDQHERSESGYLYPSPLADGRVVVVGYGPSNVNVFSGYLVIDDLQIQTHPRPEMNQRGYLMFLQPDPRGLIYQCAGGHIYLLDVDAQQFKERDTVRFSEDRGYFEHWQQDGENAWALFLRIQEQHTLPSRNQIRLWRRIGDGAWEPFSDWIDYGQHTGRMGVSFGIPSAYPFVSSGNAVWIGTHDFGVIRVDRESRDVRTLNWRHGLPLNDATWLFPLPDGQVWAGGVNDFQGSGSFDPGTIRKREQPDDRIQSFFPLTGGNRWSSTQTSDGTVYQLHIMNGGTADQLTLRKWTGQSWEHMPLEKLSIHTLPRVLRTDRQDRIWVVETHRDRNGTGQAVVIDGGAMKRVIAGKFDDLLGAYAQVEEDPGFRPGFDVLRNNFFPYISPQGHVLYLNNSSLFGYNGEGWGPVRPSDISEDYPDYRITSFGHTEDTGHAAVRIGRTTYKLTESGKWVATEAAFVRVEGGRTLSELHPGRHPHQNVIEAYGFEPESRVWDVGEGFHWIQTADARAYVTYGAWTAPVIPDGGATPLPVVDNFSAYYTTATGQRLLRVGQGWLVFPALDPGVAPEVTTNQLSPDRLRLEVSKADEVTAWRWRLNGGPWSETARHEWLEVSNLLPGQYRVDLQPLSPGLVWMSRQTVELEIAYDLQQVLTDAVRDLMSEDWDRRNLAVQRLAIAPEAAETLLQSVEADALSDEDRWWLEATLQSVRRTEPVLNQMRTYTETR